MPLDELLLHASFCPPNASYGTWGVSRGSGVSRWALEVTGKIGPLVLGAVVPPVYLHTYMHACMHACIHTYIHTYVYTYYIHNHTHTYTHTHTHTHTHR